MSRNIVNLNAKVVCFHLTGKVRLIAGQDWVRTEAAPILTKADPHGRPVANCTNVGLNKPCTLTFAARKGYSEMVRIDGRPVVLDDLIGSTDGDGGIYDYKVASPGQTLLSEVGS